MAMRPRGGGVGPSRGGRTPTPRPVYETFKPVSERQQEEDAEKLLFYLPGFLKDNIKVSTEGKSTVRVQGERRVAGNKWSRFREEFQAPEDCNMGAIHARFENGILIITMPTTNKTRTKITQSPPPLPPPPPLPQDDHTQKPLKTREQSDFPPKIPQVQPNPPKSGDEVPQRISQKDPVLPKPLKHDQDEDEDDDDDDDFRTKTVHQKQAIPSGKKPFDYPITPPKAEKTSQIRDESHMEGPIMPKHHVDHQAGEDFPTSETRDQKRKPSVGLKDIAEREKMGEEAAKGKGIKTGSFEDIKKTITDKERKRVLDQDEQKQRSEKQSSTSVGDYLKAVKGLSDLTEERQSLVNAGVAVLVILALGAHIYNTIGTSKSH